mmetsp:Transcript_134915/g.376012  ORF Transcript_134915/g.376012 Transcript_134915/m.376012 type:complete len:117 (+) Transcript_134915:67-417(+)|eukprot:CAMPEP_0179085030 /NCGR_PEP_ID=MMETSP0796-20121207/38485_1 /TAXON_ID=73915 /ORGANISM="Pyrodinium bahamense, Strain pbaha01" /LENGTH=116 /DNA_ID=CAMNT_0020782459 /DNA_START=67 /DNA_END=417 /DNA_ORIENTATION=-
MNRTWASLLALAYTDALSCAVAAPLALREAFAGGSEGSFAERGDGCAAAASPEQDSSTEELSFMQRRALPTSRPPGSAVPARLREPPPEALLVADEDEYEEQLPLEEAVATPPSGT